MRSFWTILTCLLLAVLPMGSHGVVVQDADVCTSCGCCVPPNPNPAPVRNVPTMATRTVRAEREARIEPRVVVVPRTQVLAVHFRDFSLTSAVPLFQWHCALLI